MAKIFGDSGYDCGYSIKQTAAIPQQELPALQRKGDYWFVIKIEFALDEALLSVVATPFFQ